MARAIGKDEIAEALNRDAEERWRRAEAQKRKASEELDVRARPRREPIRMEGMQHREARLAELAAELRRQTAATERIAKLVDGLSEEVDARLETFARRMTAIEGRIQDRSAKRTGEGARDRGWSRERRELGSAPDRGPVDPQRAVDDALRALTASESERDPGGD